jgi:hypothetical protein
MGGRDRCFAKPDKGPWTQNTISPVREASLGNRKRVENGEARDCFHLVERCHFGGLCAAVCMKCDSFVLRNVFARKERDKERRATLVMLAKCRPTDFFR